MAPARWRYDALRHAKLAVAAGLRLCNRYDVDETPPGRPWAIPIGPRAMAIVYKQYKLVTIVASPRRIGQVKSEIYLLPIEYN
jgi:hypothetical protein